MLGKASEIKTMELDTPNINSWLEDNSNALIIDIKYVAIPGCDYAPGGSYALIIYKEGESNG